MSEPVYQSMPKNDKVRERAIGFFRLLRGFAQLWQTDVREVEEYPDHLWLHELPDADDCYTRAKGPSEDHPVDVWVEIKHLPEPKCPTPPEVVRPWLKTEFPFGSDPNDEPELYERIYIRPQEEAPTADGQESTLSSVPEHKSLSDHPEVTEAWDAYLIEKWLSWSEAHQEWKAHHAVYARLFSIHQAQLREGERFELVLGLGCLLWLTPSDHRIVRHVLTVLAVLDFDPNQGIFSVGPSPEGIRVSVELDMLEVEERPREHLERNLGDSLKGLEEDLWDRDTLDAILRSIAKCLDDRGDYDGRMGPIPRMEKAPVIMFAPALVYRRRSARGMVATFGKIVERLEEGGDIPSNIRKLAEQCEAAPALESAASGTAPGENETYFPLPTNREQLRIVQKLGSSTGLLVQGPPGTGKSHTIANLACHLLATGKRVLITAQTPQALAVLKDKIPAGLQSLCVSVLGHDRESISRLEAAVRRIADRQANWDEDQAVDEIHEAEKRLDQLREQRALLDGHLEAVRKAEVEKHEIAGGCYVGSAKTVAERVVKEKPVYGWLSDEIQPGQELPLEAGEFRDLVEGLRRIGERRTEELSQHWPDWEAHGLRIGELPELFGRERVCQHKHESLTSSGQARYYSAIRGGANRVQIQTLDNTLKRLRASIDTVRNRCSGWGDRAVEDVLSGDEGPWKTLREITTRKIEGLAKRARAVEEARIQIAEGFSSTKLQADASDLRTHLEQGGKLGFFSSRFNPTVKRCKYILASVTVEGRPCDNTDALSVLIERLSVESTVDYLWNMWRDSVERVSGPLTLQAARLEEHLETLSEVLALERLLEDAKKAVGAIRGLAEPTWQDGASVGELFQSCQAVIAALVMEETRKEIAGIAAVVEDPARDRTAHPACGSLLKAIEDRNEPEVREVVAEIQDLERDKALLGRCRKSLEVLARVAPNLAKDLESSVVSADWDDRLLVIGAAWKWQQAQSWLKQFIAGESVEELTGKCEKFRQEILSTVERLATTKAWANCIRRLDESHRQDLVAWQQAIKRIGAGTGRHAERHRRAAQQHLAACQEAIPAWVMPMYRLYETIDPRPGMFDVVIVDEASQCALDGLLLFYVGRQIVVVGDDEQISPTRITDLNSFRYLVNQYLPDYRLSSVLQPETSLFDLGEVWFRNRIVLREHFRCMPEIIRFSNDLCYAQTPLIPLRQYPADRLAPVKAVHVAEGCEHGTRQRKTNPAEARTLVDVIVSCCHDPRYHKKSMGVISLLGDSQARLIEHELIERLGPEEIKNRGLLCGDAYSFQGDERDVVFLSLVVAPVNVNGERSRSRALTAKQYKQRYNVAASRSRDQMWLFHSITLDELRNPQDLRRRLVEHSLNPGKPARELHGLDIEELRYLASKGERPHGSQPAPFGSWFEVDVFLRIHDRGYRVIPQFPTLVDNYRIDLVVEGDKPKLAIECDGDHWHGPEQFHKDMERQRQLVRAGWTFWRIRASEYYWDQNTALESLWRKLEHLGIRPFTIEQPPEAGEPSLDDEVSARQPEPPEKESESAAPQAVEPQRKPAPARSVQGDSTGETQRTIWESEIAAESLSPYRAWESHHLPHPEETLPFEVARALAKIVDVEGPMLDSRAFSLYARAAGMKPIHRPVKDKLASALEMAKRNGLVECRRECGRTVVWGSDTPDVVVRERGDRTLQEMPPSEIAAIMRQVLEREPNLGDDALIDQLRRRLRIGRLTGAARVFLSEVRRELVDND